MDPGYWVGILSKDPVYLGACSHIFYRILWILFRKIAAGSWGSFLDFASRKFIGSGDYLTIQETFLMDDIELGLSFPVMFFSVY